ncbi:hypothetical protein C8R47DRAFT_320142 [Mycena vitilis]|nr:hypothetical protein C8R47DRAFT_320142 [Mycena vitilis]
MRLLPLPSLGYMSGARTGARTCAQTRNFAASPAHLTSRLPLRLETGNERQRHIWNMNDPTVVFPNLLAPKRLRPFDKKPGIPLGLPDDKLPEPWTCDWHAWGLLPSWYSCGGGEEIGGGEFDPRLFHLGIEGPVIPLMFRSTQRSATSTVFAACVAQRLAFYLFDEPSDSLYRFEQDHPPQNASPEEFAESADWNRMTYLGFGGEDEHSHKSDNGILRLRDLHKTVCYFC